MGIRFRSGDYERSVFLGGRTIKDGEAAAIWNVRGEHRQVIGPRRVWMWCSHIRFLDRHKAESGQFLQIAHRDGRREHVHGPVQLYCNPALHDKVSVHDGIRLDCESDFLVVYRGEAAGGGSVDSTTRMVLHGPLLFMPRVGERTHEFEWSRFTEGARKVQFHVLHANKHRTWKVDLEIFARGDSSATFSTRIAFGYHLESLEKCLASPDPLREMHASLSIDAQILGNSIAREDLQTEDGRGRIGVTEKLASLSSYSKMRETAKVVGFAIDSVRVVTLTPCKALRDLASETKKMEADSKIRMARQVQDAQAAKMALDCRNETQEREIRAKQEKLDLCEKLNTDEHACKELALERDLKLQRKKYELELEMLEAKDKILLSFLTGLKKEGVDLTKLLCTTGCKEQDGISNRIEAKLEQILKHDEE